MLTDSEQNSKKSWNVQELLKYNTTKQFSPQVLKNLEKAKQGDLVRKSTIEDGNNNDEYKVHRYSYRSRPDLDNLKIEKPLPAKKELPQLTPLLHKPRNSDAFAATGQRLAKLETLCNNQREEIKSKSQIIEKLYNDANLSKKSYQEELSLIKDENQKLKDQVESLMKLLEKNNIVYTTEQNTTPKADQVYEELPVPSDVNSSQSPSSVNNTEGVTMVDEPVTAASPLKGKLAKEIDIKLVKKRIDDLNDLIAGEQDIVKDRDGAYKFKRRDPISFCIYKNGIELEGFPFYKYSQKEAQLILEDILDGYFPAILRDKFPEGTPFELFSELDNDYDETIAKNRSPKKKIGEIARINHFATNQSDHKSQGLSNKPRDLSVNERREEDIEIIAPSVKEMKEAKNPPEEEMTTLKIRTETGKKNIILKALVSDSIKTVYELVHIYSETRNFEIWGGYPPRLYPRDNEASLRDLDISGESVFNLRGLLITTN